MSAGETKSKRPKSGTPKKSAARKRAAQGVSLSASLAQASWIDADLALAEALADLDEAMASKGAARDEALTMLAQSLNRAARKRGLTRVGDLGAKAAFDPDRHDLTARVAKTPKSVRIGARGVARGGEILVKPRVAPERKRRS
jgi:hypothetical protein